MFATAGVASEIWPRYPAPPTLASCSRSRRNPAIVTMSVGLPARCTAMIASQIRPFESL
jgi:hypothetical protein